MKKNKLEYEEPTEGFELTFYRSFPPYVKIKCPDCGKEELFSLKLGREHEGSKEFIEEMKRIEGAFGEK